MVTPSKEPRAVALAGLRNGFTDQMLMLAANRDVYRPSRFPARCPDAVKRRLRAVPLPVFFHTTYRLTQKSTFAWSTFLFFNVKIFRRIPLTGATGADQAYSPVR